MEQTTVFFSVPDCLCYCFVISSLDVSAQSNYFQRIVLLRGSNVVNVIFLSYTTYYKLKTIFTKDGFYQMIRTNLLLRQEELQHHCQLNTFSIHSVTFTVTMLVVTSLLRLRPHLQSLP
jgi:hypothetical protein